MEGKVWPLPYQKQLKHNPQANAATVYLLAINSLINIYNPFKR